MEQTRTDRFVRLPTELLEALLCVRLNGTQWRILLWVIRKSLGWNRSSATFSWYRIASDLALDRGGVVRAGRQLLVAGILFVDNGRLGIHEDWRSWQQFAANAEGKVPTAKDSADQYPQNAMTDVMRADDKSRAHRCEESSLSRRAIERFKDRKNYKETQTDENQSARRDRVVTRDFAPKTTAGAAQPIPGKYDSLSQN